MKILFAGPLSRGNSALFRTRALERLGHTIVPFENLTYGTANPLLRKLEFRALIGPEVARLNRDLLRVATEQRPDIFWAEKVLKLRPSTLRKLQAMGIVCVSYMIDNAFGPRHDPGWRLYRKCLPLFDLHVTQRDVSLGHYRERGARDVIKVQTAYEQTVHFPPQTPIPDGEMTRDVSFIGTPYDNRAEILARLVDEGIPVAISGGERPWARALAPFLSPQQYLRVFRGAELWESEYREAIWHAKINLSFLTHSNQDEYTHKSFEIAGCGGFLLAERSPGHLARFLEDEEAVFFEGYDELKAKILRWLPDPEGRARIARAGHARAVRDRYHNEGQMALILNRIQPLVDARHARPTPPKTPG